MGLLRTIDLKAPADLAADVTTKQRLIQGKTGDLTSNSTDNQLGFVGIAGKIVDVILSVGTNGVDAVDPLDLTLDVKKNGTSVCSTNPKLDKAAGSGRKSTAVSGAGITQAVLKTDGTEDLAPGDELTYDLTLTRTTPDTEFADVSVLVIISRKVGA